jgi:hypothetical protein
MVSPSLLFCRLRRRVSGIREPHQRCRVPVVDQVALSQNEIASTRLVAALRHRRTQFGVIDAGLSTSVASGDGCIGLSLALHDQPKFVDHRQRCLDNGRPAAVRRTDPQ